MKIEGRIERVARSLDGNLVLSLEISEQQPKILEKIDKLKDSTLEIEIAKKRASRSLNANAYLWVLCDKIAKHPSIRSDKDTVYRLALMKYGTFQDVSIRAEAYDTLRNHCRLCEELYSGDGWKTIRVYYGSHEYNTKEMSDLLAGVVEDCQDLGIDTMTPDELKHMAAAWRGTYE